MDKNNTATTRTTVIHCTHPGCDATGLASEFFAPEAKSAVWGEKGVPEGFLPYPEEVVAAAVCRVCWGRRRGFYPLKEVLGFLARAHRRAVYAQREEEKRFRQDSSTAEEAARRRKEADQRKAEYAARQAQRRREALVRANGAFGNNPELAAAARATGKSGRRAERMAEKAAAESRRAELAAEDAAIRAAEQARRARLNELAKRFGPLSMGELEVAEAMAAA